MLTERLQILITRDQRRRLEADAKRRGSSVASVIREAIDAQLGAVPRRDRLRAVEEIRQRGAGEFVAPEELDRLAESEHDPLDSATVR